MTSSNKTQDENDGVKRASDFSQAMLSVPGYADDSIFFVVRYFAQAQVREKNRLPLDF